MDWKLVFYAADGKMIRKNIWIILKKWSMQQRSKIFKNHFISIVIREGIILVLKQNKAFIDHTTAACKRNRNYYLS